MNQGMQSTLEAQDRARGTRENMGYTKLLEVPKSK